MNDPVFMLFEGTCPTEGCGKEVHAENIGGTAEFLEEYDGYVKQAGGEGDHMSVWDQVYDGIQGTIEFKCKEGHSHVVDSSRRAGWVY